MRCCRLTLAYLSPILTNTAAIVVWVAIWDFCVDYLHGTRMIGIIIYLLIGMICLLLTRTWFPTTGLSNLRYLPSVAASSSLTSLSSTLSCLPLTPSTLFDRFMMYVVALCTSCASSSLSSSISAQIILYVRAFVAMIGGIFIWIGGYNFIDLFAFPGQDLISHILLTCAGLIIMLIAGTLLGETDVSPAEDEEEQQEQLHLQFDLDDELKLQEEARKLTKLREKQMEMDEMNSSSSSSVEFSLDKPIYITSRLELLIHFFRSCIAFIGSVLYWVGIYNIFDVEIWENSKLRDGIFILISFVLFLVVGVSGEYSSLSHSFCSLFSLNRPQLKKSSNVWYYWFRFLDHFGVFIRIILSLLSVNLYWIGWWNWTSYYIVPPPGDLELLEDENGGGDEGEEYLENITDSIIPMWSLYIIYLTIGMGILVYTRSLIESGGVFVPMEMMKRQLVNARPEIELEGTSRRSRHKADRRRDGGNDPTASLHLQSPLQPASGSKAVLAAQERERRRLERATRAPLQESLLGDV